MFAAKGRVCAGRLEILMGYLFWNVKCKKADSCLNRHSTIMIHPFFIPFLLLVFFFALIWLVNIESQVEKECLLPLLIITNNTFLMNVFEHIYWFWLCIWGAHSQANVPYYWIFIDISYVIENKEMTMTYLRVLNKKTSFHITSFHK